MRIVLEPSPKNHPEIDRVLDDMFRRLGLAANVLADAAKAEVQKELNVEVEWVTPTLAVRSAPGEPPRTETHHLRDGIQTAVTNNGSVIEVALGATGGGKDNDPTVPAKLEHGEGNVEARPFLGPNLEWVAAEGPTILAEQMK